MIITLLRADTLIKPTSKYPAIASLTAHGEPHRRNWTIEANWNLRDGLVSGKATFHNQWLNGALWQLETHGANALRKNAGTLVERADFILYCPADLLPIARRIASWSKVPWKIFQNH